jgi:hypothetical protein
MTIIWMVERYKTRARAKNGAHRNGGARHRRKGNRVEREIVDIHKAIGIHAERVPLSNVDIYVAGRDEAPLVAEVKARRNGSGFTVIETCWVNTMHCSFAAIMPASVNGIKRTTGLPRHGAGHSAAGRQPQGCLSAVSPATGVEPPQLRR